MSLEELMKQFAELVGRNLASRWLKTRGLSPPQGNDPTRDGPVQSEADRERMAKSPSTDPN